MNVWGVLEIIGYFAGQKPALITDPADTIVVVGDGPKRFVPYHLHNFVCVLSLMTGDY